MSVSHPGTDQLHEPAPDSEGTVMLARDAMVLPALERLVSPEPSSDCRKGKWFRDWTRQNKVDLNNLWVLTTAPDDPRKIGSVRASVLAVPSPGRTAMVMASSPRSRHTIHETGRLIRHATDTLAKLDVTLGQAMLDPREALEEASFLSGGYKRLADLSFLERPANARRDRTMIEWNDPDITIECWSESIRSDFECALERSYQDTRDCPGLVGLRNTSDILTGHQSSGEFAADLWTLLRIDGEPAGVLLLNPSPASMKVELVYLGLSPAARGKGLATKLLRHGFFQISFRKERAITLAVDDANAPALALYRNAGFRRVYRRTAFIQPTGLGSDTVNK